jgi:hypothetical protein
MRGLAPRIHLLAKRMDRRVKPGDNDRYELNKQIDEQKMKE